MTEKNNKRNLDINIKNIILVSREKKFFIPEYNNEEIMKNDIISIISLYRPIREK